MALVVAHYSGRTQICAKPIMLEGFTPRPRVGIYEYITAAPVCTRANSCIKRAHTSVIEATAGAEVTYRGAFLTP